MKNSPNHKKFPACCPAATVTPDMGAETYHSVECAESAEDGSFIEFVYTVRKPR